MEKIIEELIHVCSKEIDAFNKLLETLHSKQRAIVEGELERLKNHVEDENKIVDETRALEAQRVAHTQDLAQQLSLNGNPKLSEIIEKVEERYAQRLQEQRDLLRTVIEQIHDLNENNQFLINYSLQFIETNMNLLLAGKDEKKFYRQDGKVQKESQSPKLVDHRI